MSNLLDFLFNNKVEYTIGAFAVIWCVCAVLIIGLATCVRQLANRLHTAEEVSSTLRQENAKLENDIFDLKRAGRKKPE